MVELKMPALSPTMEEGTLAKWLVSEGDFVKAGHILAEIETDKATMEFEAVDEGTVVQLVVPEGTDGVKVGAVIALLTDGTAAEAPASSDGPVPPQSVVREPLEGQSKVPTGTPENKGYNTQGKATALAVLLAVQRGIDVNVLAGSGLGGRVIKSDVDAATPGRVAAKISDVVREPVASPFSENIETAGIPHIATPLSNMRRTIARRLTESKRTIPHIYLTVDVAMDALLALRAELNMTGRGVRLSVNDFMIRALATALTDVPECNVQFADDRLLHFSQADISVAVSITGGLITPIIAGASSKSLSAISAEMKALTERARDGTLKPGEYQGGTASLSNMGMFGIKQFDAVINPPQGMILAVGAADKRPYVSTGALGVATVMTVTGSFDHRAIDGAAGARLMRRFVDLVEAPLSLAV